jgi:hypothetical protein
MEINIKSVLLWADKPYRTQLANDGFQDKVLKNLMTWKKVLFVSPLPWLWTKKTANYVNPHHTIFFTNVSSYFF